MFIFNLISCPVKILISNSSKRFLSVSSLKSSAQHYDVIVAGGGMVGTTLACTLGKNSRLSNKRIMLLESGKDTKFNLPDTHSNRVSSLNKSTVTLLKNIDAWRHIETLRFAPITNIQMWDSLSDAMISFENENPDEPLACVVENDVLLHAVKQEIAHTQNVEVVFNSKIKSCNLEEGDLVKVCLENGAEFTCNLLLGCDGANSLVRKSFEFHHISRNYNHMGVVATVKLSEECENLTAWQRSLPNSGFVALLPLQRGLSSLVWSTTTKRAKELISLTDDEFTKELNEALFKVPPKNNLVSQTTASLDNFVRYLNLPSTSKRQDPPTVSGCENRAAFPLGLGHSTNYVGTGVALVGDAAHRIHPLAGQGVNLGFGDVVCLNRVLGDVAYSGGKFASVSSLKSYETERQRQNVPMMVAVHGLFHLYSTQLTPVVVLRSLGLQVAHAMPSLKKFFMARAAGL